MRDQEEVKAKEEAEDLALQDAPAWISALYPHHSINDLFCVFIASCGVLSPHEATS
jgi:hypothetical protein